MTVPSKIHCHPWSGNQNQVPIEFVSGLTSTGFGQVMTGAALAAAQ